MTPVHMCRGFVLLAAAMVIRPVTAQNAQPGGVNSRTVLDGVYTEGQAVRGEAAYLKNCSQCHRENLQGGAEALSLTGTRFMEAWRDDTLDGLFLHMKTRMPRRPVGEPGTLSDATYIDIIAYILKVSAYPAGTSELTPGTLRGTLLVGKEGPKPLATNAQIQVVGCLTPGSGDAWKLINATEPVRTRNPEEMTAEEVKSAAPIPLGKQTFGLRNLTEFRSGFMPNAWQGHKVQAKGVLTRQPGNDRIYVLSMETVLADCVP
jgi:mono/diheme cytochrome c family protein